MILNATAAQVLNEVHAWASKTPWAPEADDAIATVIARLASDQVASGQTGNHGSTIIKEIVATLLDWADNFSLLAVQHTRRALQELGYGTFIPASHTDADVTIAGVTMRLRLPLDNHGRPYGVVEALGEAIDAATVTVIPTDPTPPADSVQLDQQEESRVG